MAEQKTPTKLGRKFKKPEDRIQGAKVYLTSKEISLIEGKYGSLTAAIKQTALVEAQRGEPNNLKFTVAKGPALLPAGKEKAPPKKIVVNNNYLEQRRKKKSNSQ